jgi:ATP:cob(I)alamin adenosyltransferase
MSIVTKTGDDGTTGLWSGERIGKDTLRVEAYGTIDELSSALGVARHVCLQDNVLYAVEYIQRLLFRVAGELASLSVAFDRPINEDDERTIETKTAEIEERIPLRGFVVPGMTQGSAALDVARAIARRAERRVVALSRTETISPVLLRTLNRMSDFIYMLAREEESAQGKLMFV